MNRRLLVGFCITSLIALPINAIGFNAIVSPTFSGDIVNENKSNIEIVNNVDINKIIEESISKYRQEQDTKQVAKTNKSNINQTTKTKKLSRGGNNPYYKQNINIVASHYSGREEENGRGNEMKNALGGELTSSTIAVPRNIKLGSLIKLTDNDGNEYIKIALDYGHTKYIKWIDDNTMKIDICKPYASRKTVSKLGIKQYKGEIIRWGFDSN